MDRDGFGRFRRLVCVNATDRCLVTDECPWCEFADIPPADASTTAIGPNIRAGADAGRETSK